jgi:hypothetical protein
LFGRGTQPSALACSRALPRLAAYKEGTDTPHAHITHRPDERECLRMGVFVGLDNTHLFVRAQNSKGAEQQGVVLGSPVRTCPPPLAHTYAHAPVAVPAPCRVVSSHAVAARCCCVLEGTLSTPITGRHPPSGARAPCHAWHLGWDARPPAPLGRSFVVGWPPSHSFDRRSAHTRHCVCGWAPLLPSPLVLLRAQTQGEAQHKASRVSRSLSGQTHTQDDHTRGDRVAGDTAGAAAAAVDSEHTQDCCFVRF